MCKDLPRLRQLIAKNECVDVEGENICGLKFSSFAERLFNARQHLLNLDDAHTLIQRKPPNLSEHGQAVSLGRRHGFRF